jgi:glycosyltransferase involved in cell wall biosynthesis
VPRVLFVSPSASLAGGASRSLVELLEALVDDERLEVVLAVPERGPLSERAEATGIRVTLAPRATWLSRAFRGTSPEDLLRRGRFAAHIVRVSSTLRHIIDAVGADVVVTNTIDGPAAALAARRARRPHVWWVREFGESDSRKRFLLGERATFRVVGCTSQRVVAVSTAVAEHVRGFVDPARVVVIRPAIPVTPGPAVVAPRPGEPLRLLLLGRVVPAKGHDVALDAVRGALDRGVAVQLRVVGDADAAFLEQLERRRATLGLDDVVEFVPWSPLLAELDAAHVVLMCSTREAFGRVTAEALGRGRPVIGARSGGTMDMVRDGVNGLLFAAGSSAALADAIARVAREPGLLDRLAAGARQQGSGSSSTAAAVDAVVACVEQATRVRDVTSSASWSSWASWWSSSSGRQPSGRP